jgi:hypothetical protein
MSPFAQFYQSTELAIEHARELGFTIFGRSTREIFAARTFGSVGHAAGAKDQLFVLVQHMHTGYADWRGLTEMPA